MRKLIFIAVAALTACETKQPDKNVADTTVVVGDTASLPKDTLVLKPTDTTFIKPDSTKF